MVDKNTLCNGCFLNKIIGSIQSLQVIWTVSHFMPCVWSQVSKKRSMKIPGNYQVRTTGSCAIVWTSLYRRPEAPQCLEASTLKTSGCQNNTVQTLGQASPNSTLSWILEVDTFWEVSESRLDDMATRLNDVQYFRIFQSSVQMRKGF
jgi:hypothetical protein